jgi:hypothetical protein
MLVVSLDVVRGLWQCHRGYAHSDRKPPQSHLQDLDLQAATPFARIVDRIKPGATGRDIVELLDGRVQRTVALNWRSGRRAPPQWAIDRLRQRWQAIEQAAAADLAQLRPGPGLKAGARNLAAWRAAQNR